MITTSIKAPAAPGTLTEDKRQREQ